MYDEIDGWYDSDFWQESFYGNDVGPISTAGNEQYLGYQAGNAGSANHSVSSGIFAGNMTEDEESAFGGFWDQTGNLFSGAANALTSAISGAFGNIVNAGANNLAGQVAGFGQQTAGNLSGNNSNANANANASAMANRNTLLVVGAVALVGILAAVYFAGKSNK